MGFETCDMKVSYNMNNFYKLLICIKKQTKNNGLSEYGYGNTGMRLDIRRLELENDDKPIHLR